MTQLLTASRMRAFRRCPRLHQYRHELRRRPLAKADALAFGSLIHAALEVWWLSYMHVEIDPLAHSLDAIDAAADEHDADDFDIAKAKAMLTGYHARWHRVPMTVHGVEVEFDTELRNPDSGHPSRTYRLAGKIDAIAEVEIDGIRQLVVVEHKTRKGDISPGSSYWQQLRLDSQVSTYLEGASALGYDVEGCLYDVLGKPGQRPLKANRQRSEDETPDEYGDRVREAIIKEPDRYYQRGVVVRLDDEAIEAKWDAWQVGKMIRESQLAERWPRNDSACFDYHRPCEYLAVCCGEASIDDDSQFTTSAVHTELDSPKEEGTHGTSKAIASR